MNKVTLVGLLAALLIPATHGFAQKIPTKKWNPSTLERIAIRYTGHLAPKVPGVYIPSGTTVAALKRRISFTALQAGITLNEQEVHVIATHPESLRQFQAQAGIALFQGRPLPIKQGLKALQANQEKFAVARANKKYEIAWEAFHVKKWERNKWTNNSTDHTTTLDISGREYLQIQELADDVYNFYQFQEIPFENLPHVRMVGVNDVEGVVLEIPVNGLKVINYIDNKFTLEVSPAHYVVVHYNNGTSRLVHRTQFEGNTETTTYRVIK